jgi:hypothetical protein
MSRHFALAIALMTVLAALALRLPAAEPKPEEIARAIKELGDDRFKVREKASAFLWKAGRAAETALQEAAASNDAEVARRARTILDKFKWGIYPDTPKEIAELIEKYRSGDANVRRQVVQELLKRGRLAHPLLTKFATAEEDPTARETFWMNLAEDLPQVVQTCILEDNLKLAEEMLEFGITHDDDRLLRDYVALLYLRGRLDEKIKELRPQIEKQKTREKGLLLTYLYRAKGDGAQAIWAAQQVEDEELVNTLLLEQHNWMALAERADKQALAGAAADEAELLGTRLAYYRLAGNKGKADEIVKAIQASARTVAPQDPTYAWSAAKALLINERPIEALALLKEHKDLVHAMELLVGQLRFEEAMALASQADTPALKLQTQVVKARRLRTCRQAA